MRHGFVLGSTVLLALATGAHAVTLTVFADRASWEAAAGDFRVENFETIPLQEFECSLDPCESFTVETPHFDLVIGNQGHGEVGIMEPGDVNGSREFLGDLHGPMSIVTVGPLFNSVVFEKPALAFATSLAGVRDAFSEPPLFFTILGEVFPVATDTTFFGVVSDMPFETVELTANPVDGLNFFYSMDDVGFTPIPEPAAGLLLAAGLAGLAARRRGRLGTSATTRE